MGADRQADGDGPTSDTVPLQVAETVESRPSDTPTAGNTHAPAIAPGTVVDRYIVTGEIGRGGMGVVLSADDPDLHRRVAIKLLTPRDALVSDDLQQRLVREGQAIAQLSHPNVVQIYDVGMHGTEVFIAMEMVEGMSLGRWLGTRRTRREILGVFVEAGRGLIAAHAKQIVHRDFKPDNVRVGVDGRVRVLDFGLARAAAGAKPAGAPGFAPTRTTMTVEGGIMGTPAYMAPEQFTGEIADERSDQFSFCVALHEALCGQRPFDGATFDELAGNVTAGRRRPMPRGARVPARLEKLVARGLATSPGDRHPALVDLIDALDRERARSRTRWLVGGSVAAAAIATPVAIVLSRDDAPPAPRPRPDPVMRQIVREAGVHLHPSLLPDGEHFVHATGLDIVLRTVDGTLVENLTESFEPRATEPEASPDGTQVAFSADGALYTIAIDGGGAPRRVGTGYWPTWSPDGKRLAYVTRDVFDVFTRIESGTGALRTIDLATGAEAEILSSDHGVLQPDWSPDGKRFAFVSDNQLSTCAADGSDVQGSEIRNAWHPVWSPDGKGIYVARERGGKYEIAWLPWSAARGVGPAAESYGVASLTSVSLWHFDVSRDARRFVGAVFASDMRTIRIDFDPVTGRATGLPRPITDPYLGLISPAVSPDGKTIAYTSMTEVEEQLYATDSAGAGGRRVLGGSEYRRAPVWRPDGSAITYQGTVDGAWGIYDVTPDGSAVRTLSTDAARFPHWSPDGKRLAITARVDGANFPYVVIADQPWEPQGRAQHDERRRGWRTAAWSPDGKSIAVISERGIGVMDATTLAITPHVDRGKDVAWLADGRMVIADRDALLLVGRDKAITPIVSLVPGRVTDLPSLDVSPSRDALYVSIATDHASLWLADLK
jgi:Tol biopolymer transport system component/serine/threonine protein kinase